MSTTTGIVVAVVLLAVNAFFVGAEFALISARRSALEPRAAHSRAARTTVRAMENVSLMMAGAQLGITICSLGLGALGEPAVAAAIEPAFAAIGLPEALLHPIAFAIALLIVVFLHVTVGEMVPKNIALAVPDRAALVLTPPLVAVVTVLRPVLWLLNGAANVTLRALRVEPREEMASAFTRDEVAGLVEQSRREGLLDRDEADLVGGALAFSDRPVATVAVPLDELVTAGPRATVADLEALAHAHGFSRLPIREETVAGGTSSGGTSNGGTSSGGTSSGGTSSGGRGSDAGGWRGYVHVKDLLGVAPADRDRPLPPPAVRPLLAVDHDAPLADALAVMRRGATHLALVRDGGVPTGVVALDDVLTALVGEIRHGAATAR